MGVGVVQGENGVIQGTPCNAEAESDKYDDE
jgi:hypothetical protein